MFFTRPLKISIAKIIARAKRGLAIRKQPSFVPGPRIFNCESLLFSAGHLVCINNLHNLTKEIPSHCAHMISMFIASLLLVLNAVIVFGCSLFERK